MQDRIGDKDRVAEVDSAQSQSHETTLPTVNYTWIGPPPGSKDISGHDVVHPKLMAEQNKRNPIIYWCLEAHKEHYENSFREHQNIKVKSIESLLEDHKNDPQLKDRAEKLLALMKELFADGKNTTRDKVAIKDIFTVYILMTQGGYTVDTNIKPQKDEEVALSHRDGFTMVKLDDGDKSPECFLMYSPFNDHNVKKMQTIFDQYLLSVEYLQKKRSNFKSYCGELGGFFINKLLAANPNYFVGHKNGAVVELVELGVVKHYYNTHTYSSNKDGLAMIFAIILRSDNEALDTLIKSNGDVNVSANLTGVNDYTPLHHAILNNNVNAVRLLLAAGANIHTDACFDKNSENGFPEQISPLNLAYTCDNEEIKDLLLNHAETSGNMVASNMPDWSTAELKKLEDHIRTQDTSIPKDWTIKISYSLTKNVYSISLSDPTTDRCQQHKEMAEMEVMQIKNANTNASNTAAVLAVLLTPSYNAPPQSASIGESPPETSASRPDDDEKSLTHRPDDDKKSLTHRPR